MSANTSDLSAKILGAPPARPIEFLSTDRDGQIFAKALLHPPKPNATLRKAVKDYRNAISS